MSYTNLTYNQLIKIEEFKNKNLKVRVKVKESKYTFETFIFNKEIKSENEFILILFSNKKIIKELVFDVLEIYDEKYNLEKLLDGRLTYNELLDKMEDGFYYEIEVECVPFGDGRNKYHTITFRKYDNELLNSYDFDWKTRYNGTYKIISYSK